MEGLPNPLIITPPGPEQLKMPFRLIPAGTLRMGARGQGVDEEPIHPVSVAAFYLAETPVTQAQFKAWTGSPAYREWFAKNGEPFGLKEPHRNHFEDQDDHPAERVTWYEAEAYARWLNDLGLNERAPHAGGTFQLPTEAQWEHACRAGSDTDYWNGDGETALAQIGWYQGNSDQRTHPVAKPPSEAPKHPYGLHDLHGNVWEWCQEEYDSKRYRLWLPHAADQLATPEATRPELAERHRRAAMLMRRFAANDLELSDEDRADLRWIGEVAAKVGKGWEFVGRAVADTFRSGAWPRASQAEACQLGGIFAGWAQSDSGSAVPDRVLRGGCWDNDAQGGRSAYRNGDRPGLRNSSLGFRLAWVPNSGSSQA